MNIIVSSWPAAGGTSAALILAHNLQLKYVYAGGLYKQLAAILVGDERGNKLAEFEQQYGAEWDYAWEDFRAKLMQNSDGYLLEGKTAGFLQEDRNNCFNIMLTADITERARRAGTDGRQEDLDKLKARDQELSKRWQELFDVNIYDLTSIRQHYDVHIDSTNLSIEQTLETIYNAMAHDARLSKLYFFPTLVKQIDEDVANFWKYGKASYVAKLEDQDLYLTPSALAKQIVTTQGNADTALKRAFIQLSEQ